VFVFSLPLFPPFVFLLTAIRAVFIHNTKFEFIARYVTITPPLPPLPLHFCSISHSNRGWRRTWQKV